MAKYDLNLRDYWRTIRKRKFIIFFTVVSMGFFSLFWSIIGKPTPIYKTSTSIKIERTGSMTGLYAQTFSFSPTNYLETQSSVIKSYVLLEAVAKQMGLIPLELTPDQIRTNSKYLNIVLDLKTKVETEQEGNTDIINIIVSSEDPKFAQSLANTIARVFKEEHVLDLNRRTFEAKKFLESQLKVIKAKTDKSEEEVRKYRENNKLISLDAQSSGLLGQSARLQATLDLDTSTLQKINEISRTLQKAEENPLTSKTSFYVDDAPTMYKGLNDRLVQLIMERDTLLLTYTENFPQAIEIKKQIHEIISTMKSQLASRKKSLEANIKSLRGQIRDMDEKIMQIPERGLDLARLERDVGVNREVYTLLEKKYQEALIQEAEKIEEVKIVKPALEPVLPINPPKTAANTVVGTIIGLILGIVFAFMIETFDTSIGAIEEVEEFLGVKVLGIIPFVSLDEIKTTLQEKISGTVDDEAVRKTTRLISHFLPTSISAENFRALRTNFNFINLDHNIKTVVFTSSSPEEGKTTISVNLAITMAQGGNKVLLIEGDLRRPVISRIFGIEQSPGLTDVILGNYEWRNVVRSITDLITGKMSMDEIMQTPGLDNLHIITGGTSAPNPAELVSSKMVNDFLKQAQAEYDIILIDAPPILAATDAAIWSALSDGAILVYQVGRIARGALKRAKAQLDNTGAKIFGIVLNGLKAEISPDFAYHDKYYYYYGDKKLKKPTIKDKIISVPERVTGYFKGISTKLSDRKKPVTEVDENESVEKEAIQTPLAETTQEIEKKPAKISGLKIGLVLFTALSFLGLGILYQSGLIGFHDSKDVSNPKEAAKPVPVKKPVADIPQQAPSQVATPSTPAVVPAPGDKTKPSTADWGTILSAQSKTNIRKERSTNSKIVGSLEPGQKVKADFLKDDWYAVFNVTDSQRDEKKALGYVHAPRLSPGTVKQPSEVKAPSKTPYSIQIKALPDLKDAQRLVEALRKQGMEAYSSSIDIPGKGIWHRIYIGQFNTKEQATEFMNGKNIKRQYPDSMVKQIEQAKPR
jgi:succinoglycan biosynthesis transport protein ExoP